MNVIVFRRSSIIIDPKPTPEQKITGGALDVIIAQDVSDDVILKRAFGRTCE